MPTLRRARLGRFAQVLSLLALPLSPPRKNVIAVLLLAFLMVAASNVFFTVRRYREWIRLSSGRRDRVAMLRFIKTRHLLSL